MERDEGATTASSSAPSLSGSAEPPAPARTEGRHLTLAAIYLDQGQDEKACLHLGFYLDYNPDHINARFYHAELLRRLGRVAQSREQFAQTVVRLQEQPTPDLPNLIDCYSKLVDLAEKEDNEFERQLYRGIALYWLSQAPAGTPAEEDLLPVEGLLCKAASCLTEAHHLDSAQARPCWYLHLVWHKLGQTHPSRRFLNLARAAAPFSHLTPAEHRALCLAEQRDLGARR